MLTIRRPHAGLLAAALAAAVAGAVPAAAWNGAGHMIIAGIAYQDASPALREKVAALLRKAPWYEAAWKPDEPASGEADEYLWMRAAVWPDVVRRGAYRRYHRGEWHYVNLPLEAEGPPTRPPLPDGDHILTALAAQRKILRDAKAGAEARALALCWVMHLVGDLHQPLHTTTLISSMFPNGDRGGTLLYVRVGSGRGVKLHVLWDNALGEEDSPRDARNEAIRLRKAVPSGSFSRPPKSAPSDWVRESYSLARRVAYDGGRLQGAETAGAAEALPDGYTARLKETAERQAAKAGYRLASVLASDLK